MGRTLIADGGKIPWQVRLNKRNSIGFNTKGEIAFPELMKPLLGVSGLSVVALDEDDRHDDAVARLLADLTAQLHEAGVTVSPHPSLEAALRATLPLWASFVGNMRDSALCGFMLTLAARPDVAAWQIALDPEQPNDATPKLVLIDATTMPAASNEVPSMSEC